MPIRKKENRKGGMHLKRRPALYLCRAVAIWICGIAGVWPAFAQRNMQDIIERPNNSKFNIGVKAGFNASMFLVSDFKIQDVTIDEIQNNYRVGYFGALFMRINMKKHFIQPEVSYNVSKCEITFDKLGSHDMFIADVVNVRADERHLNAETGKLELAEANPLVYVHGGYYELGNKIGKFGWSVEKKK